MSENLKNILVVKLSALGDVIHALPVSYAIKETFPDAKLTWVVEPPAYDLIKMNPCVDRIIVFHKKEFRTFRGFMKRFFPFRKEIQQENYDAVLDLQGLFKSAAIAFFAKANVKLGVYNMREMSGRVSKPVIGEHVDGHIVERYLDTAQAIGCKIDKVAFPIEIPADEIKKTAALLQQSGMNAENPYVVFAIGASRPNKRWTPKNFAELGSWFFDLNVTPVLIGSGAADEQLAAEVEANMEIPPVNLVGQTNLMQLAQVLKNARLVIGGDTGTVHLAAALATRVLMLTGPTDPKRNGPYGQLQNVIEADRHCKHCWKRICPKNEDCLSIISVNAVKYKISAMK